MRKLALITFVFLLVVPSFSFASWHNFLWLPASSLVSLQKTPVVDATKAKEEQIKVWKIPSYMAENLQYMVDDFNRKFQEKLESYKKELKARFVEFKDMPDDAMLDMERGIFLKRSDYLRFQLSMQAQKRKENKK